MSQGQATRSTLGRSRVTHFMSPPGSAPLARGIAALDSKPHTMDVCVPQISGGTAMQATALIRPGEVDQWDQALYAFLAEKERRSGSMRTVQSYSRMLQHFFGLVEKTPERITSPEVFSWAHGIGLSGKRPSSITIGARLACLSSFYKFLIRMGLMAA